MRVVSPVIILGAPRSGTTMLATLFEQHPDVTVVREPRLVWRFGNDRRSDELRPEHATPKVVAHIHSTFDARLLPGRRQLVEKTPAMTTNPFLPLILCYGVGAYPFSLGRDSTVLFHFTA